MSERFNGESRNDVQEKKKQYHWMDKEITLGIDLSNTALPTPDSWVGRWWGTCWDQDTELQ